MRLCRACVITSLAAVLMGCSPFASSSTETLDGSPGTGGGTARSCKTLLEQQPLLKGKNDYYDLGGSGADGGPAFKAYCDMTLDGGGWTLVGRSAPFAATPAFGWQSTTGNVTDLNTAYSIDVLEARLTFGEILIAARASASPDASERAYKFSVAPGFVAAHTGDSVPTGNRKTLLGDCNAPAGGPTMLKNVGATSFKDGFFLRDLSGLNIHNGLKADGFDLVYQDCTQGGYLDKRQGLVFVR